MSATHVVFFLFLLLHVPLILPMFGHFFCVCRELRALLLVEHVAGDVGLCNKW